MWIFIVLVFLPLESRLVHCQPEQIYEFATAMMSSLGNTNPAFIVDLEQNPIWATAWTLNWRETAIFIPAATDHEDINAIICNLDNLLHMDEVDFIVLMTTIEQEQVSTLVDKIGSVWPTITMLIPQQFQTAFPLRLDSRLFSYKISGSSIVLFEKFHIRHVNICYHTSNFNSCNI